MSRPGPSKGLTCTLCGRFPSGTIGGGRGMESVEKPLCPGLGCSQLCSPDCQTAQSLSNPLLHHQGTQWGLHASFPESLAPSLIPAGLPLEDNSLLRAAHLRSLEKPCFSDAPETLITFSLVPSSQDSLVGKTRFNCLHLHSLCLRWVGVGVGWSVGNGPCCLPSPVSLLPKGQTMLLQLLCSNVQRCIVYGGKRTKG